MISEYTGLMYREGIRDESHEVEVNHGDGYLHGVCDICESQSNDSMLESLSSRSVTSSRLRTQQSKMNG